MSIRRRPRERGLSLLETSLAIAVLASLSAGIFMATRAQQDGFTMLLGDLRGLQETEVALDRLVSDMRLASAFSVNATDSMTFTVPAGISTLRLGPVTAGAPRDRRLLYDPAGPESERSVTRARLLQNHNPAGLTLPGADPDGTVPLFETSDARHVRITLVLQAGPAAPVRVLRSSVTRRHGL